MSDSLYFLEIISDSEGRDKSEEAIIIKAYGFLNHVNSYAWSDFQGELQWE